MVYETRCFQANFGTHNFVFVADSVRVVLLACESCLLDCGGDFVLC